VTVEETLQEWDFFDEAITRHGFTEYNRDYSLAVFFAANGSRMKGEVTYLFRGCVEAQYESVLPPDALAPTFVDDRFTDGALWEAAGCPEGHVWNVNYTQAHPGWEYVHASERAGAWAERLRLPMHEVRVETNIYRLTLVFHDLVVLPAPGADHLAGTDHSA